MSATMVRVTCHAQHPDPQKHGQRCGAELPAIDHAERYRFVGLSARKPAPVNGRVRRQCQRRTCRTWNIFEHE